METKIKYRSIYTEISLDNLPFKQRVEYDIDWTKIIDISTNCGMIDMTETIIDNKLTRTTVWDRITSYNEWLANSYIQVYIKQRDEYNIKNNIEHFLKFKKINEN